MVFLLRLVEIFDAIAHDLNHGLYYEDFFFQESGREIKSIKKKIL